MNTTISLPESKLTKKQVKKFTKDYIEKGKNWRIVAEVRHDDECGNGHNTFSVTGTIYLCDIRGNPVRDDVGGCLHEEIAKHFPELAPFIKWHLTSTDGPMHYIANAIYHAGDRDCWGLRKGEFRQHTSRGPNQNGGVEGVPNWVLELPDKAARDVYSMEKPAPVTLEWKAYGRTGEGKERDLKAARSCAVWPEATDEQLSAEPEVLRAMLEERLPTLMEAFKRDVESLGFVY
jgi:hypothetical protein